MVNSLLSPAESAAVTDSLARLCEVQRAEIRRLRAENAALYESRGRLRDLANRLCDRVYAAHCVLANLAEKRTR